MVKENLSGTPKVTGRRVEITTPPEGGFCEYFTYEDITFLANRTFTQKTGNLRKVIHRCSYCKTVKNAATCQRYGEKLRWTSKGHFHKCSNCLSSNERLLLPLDWNGSGSIDSLDLTTGIGVGASRRSRAGNSGNTAEDPRSKKPNIPNAPSHGCLTIPLITFSAIVLIPLISALLISTI